MSDYIRLLIFRTLGNFLVIISLVMIGKTFLPIVYQEGLYYYRKAKNIKTSVATIPQSNNLTIISPTSKPNPFLSIANRINEHTEIITPVDPNFSIVIPKINANNRVIANVDSSNYDEYIRDLKIGVAHARGTAFPGDKSAIYLFAHSTDSILNFANYNAVFYLLYKLEPRDEVYLFYRQKKYLYKVIDKKIVSPEQVEYLTRQSNEEFLTLQTCWPPGTTLQRLLVFAVPMVK